VLASGLLASIASPAQCQGNQCGSNVDAATEGGKPE
jgi:hypothetical protein